MADVIDFHSAKLLSGPHLTSPALCVCCGHEWDAVTPLGTFDELECPECHTFKGVLMHGVSETPTWICDCGCWLFTVSPNGVFCWQCGVQHDFDDDDDC